MLYEPLDRARGIAAHDRVIIFVLYFGMSIDKILTQVLQWDRGIREATRTAVSRI